MSNSRLQAVALWTLLSSVSCPRPAASIDDAEWLAMELSGELLAPPGLTTQIDGHLAAVRSEDPLLEIVHVFPEWEPGILFVRLSLSAFQEFLNGTYTGLDALNAQYGPVEITAVWEFANAIVLDFEAEYNSDVLGPIYETGPGVAEVSPSYYFGDGPDITSGTVGTYTFKYGWGDCPVGCPFNHFWLYTVAEFGDAILLDEWGDPLPVALATPEGVLLDSWSRVKSRYR